MAAADFDEPVLPETKKAKLTMDKKGEKRSYLKVFETLPSQLLNSFGQSAYVKQTDAEVWKQFSEPQQTGALWMTELCSAEEERRGVGINRFLLAMLNYTKYQQLETVKLHNKAILKEAVFDAFYSELDAMGPLFAYCLADKKERAPAGASALRGKSSQNEGIQQPGREAEKLKADTRVVYDWLQTNQKSYIRMVMQWQACGGLSFVSATHHRGAQCFKYEGNALHDNKKSKVVSLEEFQSAVTSRHNCTKQEGISVKDVNNADFE